MVATIRRVTLVAAIAAVILSLPLAGQAASSTLTGSIFTTDNNGETVNQNHFFVKEEVFLNGGPQHPGGPGLPPGDYYFQVTDTSGRVLLSLDPAHCRQLTVGAEGRISGVVHTPDPDCSHAIGANSNDGVSPNGTTPVQLYPFGNTSGKGGTYKVYLIPQSGVVTGCNPTIVGDRVNFTNNCAHSDNFSVDRQAAPACAAWQDNFGGKRLDEARWEIQDRPAPGSSATNDGDYVPGHVSVGNGMLTLKLTQTPDAGDGPDAGNVPGDLGVWKSSGAQISTRVACGYGTYEFTMRMGSATNGPSSTGANLSGGISAGFVFAGNSHTEIVVEHSAHTSAGLVPPKGNFSPNAIWLVTVHNQGPLPGEPGSRDPFESEETNSERELPDVYSNFHNYKFVWEPGLITYYVDGVVQAIHDTNVPSLPGFLKLGFFGRDFLRFGGLATEGTRYFFVRSVGYTPLK